MDFEFIGTIMKLLVVLAITLGLMFVSFKLMGTKLDSINNNKYIKIIERVQVTKDNFIFVVKIGNKGYVLTSTSGHMERLSELSEEEIKQIEEEKKKTAEEITENYNKVMLKSKKMFSKLIKNINLKEEKHEK